MSYVETVGTGALEQASDVVQERVSSSQLSYLSADEWDEFSASFDDIFHEQTAAFTEARWSKEKCEFVAVEHAGEQIGGAALVVIDFPVLETGLAVLKWGPIWRRTGETASPHHLALVLDAIKTEFVEKRDYHLTVMPRGDAYCPEAMVRELESQGFKKGQLLPSPTRYLVNVDQTEDDLRASLSQKWRYNLKKANKNTFDIEITTDASALGTFMSLYEEMLQRKGFLDHSAIDTLPPILKSAPAKYQPEFVFVKHNDKLCAAAVIDKCGDCALYLYGATSDDALHLRAGYVLHWAVVQQLCSDPAVKWYDLGGNDLDRGLHQFKSGFVGKTGLQVDCPENYHLSRSWRAALLGKGIFALRDCKQSLDQWRSQFLARFRR